MTYRAQSTLVALAAAAGISVLGASARAADAWTGTTAAQAAPPATQVAQAAPLQEQAMTEMTRPNRALLTSGLLTIFASYTPAIIVAATSDHRGDSSLFIPVAGPWMDLAQRRCEPGRTACCGTTPLEAAALITTGVAHLAGVAQLVAAFVTPERHSLISAPVARAPKLDIGPASLGGRGYGLSASGSF